MANTIPSLEGLSAMAQENGIVTTIIAMGLWMITQILVERIKRRPSKPAEVAGPTSLEDLRNHRLFQHCQYYVSFGIKKIKFSPDYPMRGRMYKDMLEIYFDVMSNTFKDNLARLATSESSVWSTEAMKALRAAMDEYEQQFIEKGVPEIVIDKFADWHQPSIEFITNNIHSLNDSRIANDSARKTSVLFGTILNATKTAIFSAERTLIVLNGELSGKTYKGEVIE
jgi:hypothetical protein